METLVINRENRGGFTVSTSSVGFRGPLAISRVFNMSEVDYIARTLGVRRRELVDALDDAETFGRSIISVDTSESKITQRVLSLRGQFESDNLIAVEEEVQVPGTNIVLEAGDSVKVISQDSLKENAHVGDKAYEVLSGKWEDEKIDYVEFGGRTYDLVGFYKDVHPVIRAERIVIVFVGPRGREETHHILFRDVSFFNERDLFISLVDGSEYEFK